MAANGIVREALGDLDARLGIPSAAPAGRARRAPLRPSRRDAPRPRGEVALARLRAHRARRPSLRTGHRRRQGRRHGPRGRHRIVPEGSQDAPAQREVHHRGRGGDRLEEPGPLPRAVPGEDGRGLHRAHRHPQLRRRPPRAHLSAPRHLPGGRGGAGPPPAAAQRQQRARARSRADPLRHDRRPPQAERRPERARPLRQGGAPQREAARAHPEAAAVGGQVQEGRRHASRRAAVGRKPVLAARAHVDAAGAHRDRAGGAPVPRLVQPDHRGGPCAPLAPHRPRHGRARGRPPHREEAHHQAALRREGHREDQRHHAVVDH